VAEKALGNLPDNDELLLVLADMALNNKRMTRRFAMRAVVTVLNKRAKPEGVSAADWERKKSAALGRGFTGSPAWSTRRDAVLQAIKT